jgi:hypothetical protein
LSTATSLPSTRCRTGRSREGDGLRRGRPTPKAPPGSSGYPLGSPEPGRAGVAARPTAQRPVPLGRVHDSPELSPTGHDTVATSTHLETEAHLDHPA